MLCRRSGVALCMKVAVAVSATAGFIGGGFVPASIARAAVVQGSCYDLLSFDGLDSRYSSTHCASALTQAGYAPNAYDNGDARVAAARSSADAVFFDAGHAVVDNGGSGPTTAVALMYEPSSGINALLGDPSASPDLDNSPGICDDTGSCTTIPPPGLIAYPWAYQSHADNLAVLEACQTAATGSLFADMTTLLYDFGVGTTIGFAADVSFPVNAPESNTYGQAWANQFWSDLAGGETYSAAAVDAANAVGNGYGFDTWVEKQNPGAPNSLYPAEYYAEGVPVQPAATRPATSTRPEVGTANRMATRAASSWLGAPLPSQTRWQLVPSMDGGQQVAVVPGIGLIKRDASSGSIIEAVFEGALRSSADHRIPAAELDRAAGAFARAHFMNFDALEMRSSSMIDHGTFTEQRFTWQLRKQGMWLPTSVTVGMNTSTGAVGYYTSQRAPVALGNVRVTAAQAQRDAETIIGHATGAGVSQPSLQVVHVQGQSSTVWVTDFSVRPTGRVSVPERPVIWTDATTGRSQLVAH